MVVVVFIKLRENSLLWIGLGESSGLLIPASSVAESVPSQWCQSWWVRSDLSLHGPDLHFDLLCLLFLTNLDYCLDFEFWQSSSVVVPFLLTFSCWSSCLFDGLFESNLDFKLLVFGHDLSDLVLSSFINSWEVLGASVIDAVLYHAILVLILVQHFNVVIFQ